jgi:Holliday junction resolvase-like predicted endonuclease
MTKVVDTTEDMLADGSIVLTVSSKDESIDVIMYRKIMDLNVELPDDTSKSMVNGTERQLQEWLSRRNNWLSAVGTGTSFLCRELKTDTGSVDLVGVRDADHRMILIEVKRRANRNDVFQVLRYKDAVMRSLANHDEDRLLDQLLVKSDESPVADPTSVVMSDPVCMIIAETAHEGTMEACDEHGVGFVLIGSQWRGKTVDATVASLTAVDSRKRKAKRDHETTEGLF